MAHNFSVQCPLLTPLKYVEFNKYTDKYTESEAKPRGAWDLDSHEKESKYTEAEASGCQNCSATWEENKNHN